MKTIQLLSVLGHLFISYWRSAVMRYILAGILALSVASNTFAEQINAYTEDSYPLQFIKDGQLTGFSVEVVNRLFELTGDSGNISVMPWAKAYNTALSDKNAMLFSIARNKIPEKQFHWVGTLVKQRIYFWGLKSQFQKTISNIEDLKQYQTTVLLNSEVSRHLAEKGFVKLLKVTDANANIITMYRGQSDLMMGTLVDVRLKAKALNINFNKLFPVAELGALETDLSIGFNKSSDLSVVSRYRNALRKMARSGELAALSEKWNIVISE